jgi:hypothetical protein
VNSSSWLWWSFIFFLPSSVRVWVISMCINIQRCISILLNDARFLNETMSIRIESRKGCFVLR